MTAQDLSGAWTGYAEIENSPTVNTASLFTGKKMRGLTATPIVNRYALEFNISQTGVHFSGTSKYTNIQSGFWAIGPDLSPLKLVRF